MRGHDLLRSLRERYRDLPVVVLSSRNDEPGKVEALDFGADDYVTKPFGMGELIARIRTALRHQLAVQGERAVFEVDGLSVDLVRRIVRVNGAEVKLTPREYDFLRVLVQHAGRALTHSQLLSNVAASSDPQYLRVYMRQLRQKLEVDLSGPASSSPRPASVTACAHPTRNRARSRSAQFRNDRLDPFRSRPRRP